MKKPAYLAPAIRVMAVSTEGIICFSQGGGISGPGTGESEPANDDELPGSAIGGDPGVGARGNSYSIWED